MMNRWIGIATVVLMIAVNAALLMRDLMPGWTAGEPPRSRSFSQRLGTDFVVQHALFDADGKSMGYTWVQTTRGVEYSRVETFTALEPINRGIDVVIPRLRIRSRFEYREDGRLNELKIQVDGLETKVELIGKFVAPNDFPCEWQFGENRGNFVMPADATRATGDVLRPFESLTNLHVGQSWRLNLFNPLGAMLPGLYDLDMTTEPLVARVSRVEEIEYAGLGVRAFVVEADRLRAWVTPLGRVVRQEMEIPLLGTLTLQYEPYDPGLRARMMRPEARIR